MKRVSENHLTSINDLGDRDIRAASHDHFNTHTIRRIFAVPPPGDVPNIATFYRDVIGIIRELVDKALPRANCNNMIQLEVVGENVREYVSGVVDDQGGNVLPVFEGLLDRV